MEAVNPFAILGVDEAATRDEIEDAYRRLLRVHHPDRHATESPQEQSAATERMAAINYAYGLLTDPERAAAHKRTFDRLRAAGHDIDPAPRPDKDDGLAATAAEDFDYRSSASSEFTVTTRERATPWTARPPKPRRFGTR